MSKNDHRYKEDFLHIDEEELDVIETPKFEKFKHDSKKKKPSNDKKKNKNEDDN